MAAQQLGFSAAEQIPAWLMHTTNRYGGITLGAFVGGELVGFSYALAGFDSRPFLLSCGLAVAKGYESRGIGEALKLAQAEHARRAGYDSARWTTNALASRPLHLYLSKLGAKLVRYHQDMYRHVQDVFCPDEVELEWNLHGRGAIGASTQPASLTVSQASGHGSRCSMDVDTLKLESLVERSYCVEIPWDRTALERCAPALGEEWIAAVRHAMQALLAGGFVGTSVLADRTRRRAYVRFDRPEPAVR